MCEVVLNLKGGGGRSKVLTQQAHDVEITLY